MIEQQSSEFPYADGDQLVLVHLTTLIFIPVWYSENQTLNIHQPDSFRLFDYQTSLVFGFPLYPYTSNKNKTIKILKQQFGKKNLSTWHTLVDVQ